MGCSSILVYMKYIFLIIMLILTGILNAQIAFNKTYYFVGDSTNTRNEVQSVIETNKGYLSISLCGAQPLLQFISVALLDINSNKIKRVHRFPIKSAVWYTVQSLFMVFFWKLILI